MFGEIVLSGSPTVLIELILFGLSPEVKPSPLIQRIIEPEIVLVETPPPEPTLEEKIATNYYKCDESIEWIRKDTAQCLTKQTESQYKPQSPVVGAVRSSQQASKASSAPSGYYDAGWCTYGAWLLTGWAGSWGDAHSWDNNARADGYRVTSTPEVGSIFVDNGGALGHVGVVIAVNGNTITIKEMNYEGFGVWSTRTTLASNFVYIHRN